MGVKGRQASLNSTFLVVIVFCVDVSDQVGWTPLHMAAYKGHLEVLQRLVARGGRVDTQVHTEAEFLNGISVFASWLHCAIS